MELALFDQVAEAVYSLVPDGLGSMRTRVQRGGVKIWFDADAAPREHFEAQMLARRHVDGVEGVAVEIGFHAEHREAHRNTEVIDRLRLHEPKWRKRLGAEAEVGAFYGAKDWRRISEAWIEPDLDDPELAFEIAARLVDYLGALEPLLEP